MAKNDFVVGKKERFSYAEFDNKVDRLATGLAQLGATKGDNIACWLTNGPDWLLTWFACCRLGATLVFINTRYKTEEIGFILQQSDAKILVAMSDHWGIDYLSMIAEMVPGYEFLKPGSLKSDSLPKLSSIVL